MTALNGTPLDESAVPAPSGEIAERVYTDEMEDGDTPWDELDPSERSAIERYAGRIMLAHLEHLTARGVRLIPPGAVPVPQSEPEAMAMVRAAKSYLDGQKRKGKLLSEGPRGLILPKGRVQ